MKKSLVVMLLSTFLFGSVLMAQPSRNPEDMAKRETEWMKKNLSLTEKQIPVVDSLNLVFAKEKQKIFESSQGDFSAVRPKMEKIDADLEIQLKNILTEEQMKIYKKKQSERRPGPGGPGGQGGPGGEGGPGEGPNE